MATGSSEATSPDTEFGIKDISALHEALCPVSAKYKFFGLQIGVDINEIKKIEANYKDSSDCLLEILCSRLNQEPALTCADICKALRSRSVNERQFANSFQSRFECQSMGDQNKVKNETGRESSKKRKAKKVSESATVSEKESEYESDSENVQSAKRQVHERDEPKSKRAQKRARKKERSVKSQCASEQPVSESAIQLRMSKKETKRIEKLEGEDESKSDESENIQKAVKSAKVERQVHERNEPKSKQAKKRARKREKSQCASEQPEPDEYKEDERKQMKGKQKQKIQFSEMAASPQSGAESDQKSEKTSHEIMNTDSENESSDACKEKEILLSKNEKTGKIRESGAYSEVKHQPQSAKIREAKNEARKKGKIPEREELTKKQYSVLHRKIAVAVESDEDTSERPSHKSKKKLEAEETESEESVSESTSDESETESPKHEEKVKPKSLTDTEEMCHDSDEEIEKVRAKDKKKMLQKSKVTTAKSSPHSERLVEEEQYKQKKEKRSVDMKEQERKSGLPAKGSRGKLHKPHSQVKERERVKETNSGMKAKGLVAHSSEQASDESETDCENEGSDSGNDSSQDGEDSEGKSSDEEEKSESDDKSSTAPSEEEVKKKKKEKKEYSGCHKKEKARKEERKWMEKRVSKAAVEQSKYDSPQRERWFDETHTRKVKGKRKSEAASLKYDSLGDDDPGHGSRDQEEHDIQQKRRKKKKQRRESSMSPTVIGSSSPSTSQEEKKKQPVSKKQGHRKKHVRKMKEKSGYGRCSSVQKRKEAKNRRQEILSSSSETDSSSPECDMQTNLTNIEKRRIRTIFKCSFGKLCCTHFDPVSISVLLQGKGLISQEMMKEMILSPESQQTKTISLVTALDKRIKSRPDKIFRVIEVLLESDALQEAGKEMLSRTG